jgi:hypothetical protein
MTDEQKIAAFDKVIEIVNNYLAGEGVDPYEDSELIANFVETIFGRM